MMIDMFFLFNFFNFNAAIDFLMIFIDIWMYSYNKIIEEFI